MSRKKKASRSVPKRIAGVKVPKAVRKSVGHAISLGDTPAMRKIVASTLIAAAAALVGSEAGEKAKVKAKAALDALKHGNREEVADAIAGAMSSALTHWFGNHDVAAPMKPASGRAVPSAAKH